MAMHFSSLAWRILWTEAPGRLQSMELQRVGHDESDGTCTQNTHNIKFAIFTIFKCETDHPLYYFGPGKVA